VLVRPDGIVAWIAPDARDAVPASLSRVLAEILDW
jgi:hypothetical protein